MRMTEKNRLVLVAFILFIKKYHH